MVTPQPVHRTYDDAPLYGHGAPDDAYQPTPGPYTVTIAGPERHRGAAPYTYVVDEHSAERAWARALAWHMTQEGTPDAYVIPSKSYPGTPPPGHDYDWTDLRPEQARRQALDDLAANAAARVAEFRAKTAHLVCAGGDVAVDDLPEYDMARADATHDAWSLIQSIACHSPDSQSAVCHGPS